MLGRGGYTRNLDDLPRVHQPYLQSPLEALILRTSQEFAFFLKPWYTKNRFSDFRETEMEETMGIFRVVCPAFLALALTACAIAREDPMLDRSNVLSIGLFDLPFLPFTASETVRNKMDELLWRSTVGKSFKGPEGKGFLWRNPTSGVGGVVVAGKENPTLPCRAFSSWGKTGLDAESASESPRWTRGVVCRTASGGFGIAMLKKP